VQFTLQLLGFQALGRDMIGQVTDSGGGQHGDK
jgi:hypothetical protein